MRPIFTKKNMRIMGIILLVAGFFLSGMFMALYRLIVEGGDVAEEVKITAGTALLVAGPWIIRFSSWFGDGGGKK